MQSGSNSRPRIALTLESPSPKRAYKPAMRALRRVIATLERSPLIEVEPHTLSSKNASHPAGPAPSKLDTQQISAAKRALKPGQGPMTLSSSDLLRLMRVHGKAFDRQIALAAALHTGADHRLAGRVLSCRWTGHVFAKGTKRDGSAATSLSNLRPSALETKFVTRRCACRCCPHCSDIYRARLRDGIARLTNTYAWPSFVTLTLRHTPEDSLRDLLDKLQHAWRALMKRKTLKDVNAGVRVVEIKQSAQGWHPHMHLIVDAEWIDKGALRDAWRKVTGDSDIVDVRRIRDKAQIASYLSKYLSKPSAIENANALAEYATATHNRRLISAFGASYRSPILAECEFDEQEGAPEGAGWFCVGTVEQILQLAEKGHATAVALVLANAPACKRLLRAGGAEGERAPDS